MSELRITGHLVTLLTVAQINSEQLLQQIRQLDMQRTRIRAAVAAGIKEAARGQGIDLPDEFQATITDEAILVTFLEEDGQPPDG